MFNNILNQLNVPPRHIKIFLSTFIAMFIIMTLHYMGIQPIIKPPKFSLPQKENTTNLFDSLKPKLQEKKNDFKLKHEPKLTATAYAATNAESANSYTVVDFETGEIITDKDGAKRVPIASLTKVMTAVVAMDLAEPSDLFTVYNSTAEVYPTRLGMVPGERMSLEEMLHASLLTSANDAAQQIKDGIDTKYGEAVFIKAMNEKAAFLGMKDSHFTNPQGYDYGENYSTAEDMARLTHYALTSYPLIAEIVAKDYQFYPANENHKQFDMYNWNGLIGVYPDTKGVKIGNTPEAGYTTIAVSERNNKKMMTVLLGAPDVLHRDLWAAELLDIGYQKTLGLEPMHITEDQLQQKYSTWEYWN